jgi:hypothetical protein
LSAKWDTEKKEINAINAKKTQIDKAKHALETAEAKYDLETAARIQHGTLPQLKAELAKLEAQENGADN